MAEASFRGKPITGRAWQGRSRARPSQSRGNSGACLARAGIQHSRAADPPATESTVAQALRQPASLARRAGHGGAGYLGKSCGVGLLGFAPGAPRGYGGGVSLRRLRYQLRCATAGHDTRPYLVGGSMVEQRCLRCGALVGDASRRRRPCTGRPRPSRRRRASARGRPSCLRPAQRPAATGRLRRRTATTMATMPLSRGAARPARAGRPARRRRAHRRRVRGQEGRAPAPSLSRSQRAVTRWASCAGGARPRAGARRRRAPARRPATTRRSPTASRPHGG